MDNNLFTIPMALSAITLGVHPISYTVTANTYQPTKKLHDQEYIKYALPIESSRHLQIRQRLAELASFKPNWNDDGADVPSEQTFLNVERFIREMPTDLNSYIKEENISLTPYGTVVLDFENSIHDLVSIEIGKDKIGFFTEINSGESYRSEGIKIGIDEIPKEIIPAFKALMA